MSKQQTGFTIVELLIVIVVIAILAAISVVAYSGIQNRAKNSQIATVAASYVKALRLYEADNGRFPAHAEIGGSGYACLGSYEDDTCGNHSGVPVSPVFNSLIGEYVGSAELPSLPEDYVYTNLRNNWWRGVFYRAVNPNIWFVQYKVSECPPISGATVTRIASAYDGNIICQVTLQE